jgi:hypothetical protein
LQLRSNCSSDQPGWVPYNPLPQAPAALSALQLGLVAAAASLVAACGLLGAVLVLRWRDQRRWQALKGMDAELALVRAPPRCAGASTLRPVPSALIPGL